MRRLFAGIAFVLGILSCGDAATSPLTLAPTYHLRLIDGATLPITDATGGILDSGRVIRLGADSVRIDQISHVPATNGNPSLGVISLGYYRANQAGSTVLFLSLQYGTVDTATIAGDTLTIHNGVHTRVYTAP